MAIPIRPTSADAQEEPPAQRHSTSMRQWFAAAVLLAGIAFVFGPTLLRLEKLWRTDPDQAHGYLVVPFVVYLIWSRRPSPNDVIESGSPLWGLVMLAFGLALRFVGVYAYFDWLQAAAVVPCLLGIGMIVWGPHRALLHWGAIAFLLFMIPLPYRLATWLAYPLQRIAAVSATYMLETLGYYASCMGTTIHIGDHAVDVVAACSGMKILMTFFALSVAVSLCNPQRPWWERLIITLAAVPVALAANVVRIIITAAFYQMGNVAIAQSLFHDLAGWLMMPIAMLLLGLWTLILRLCVVVDEGDVHERHFLSQPG